MARRGLVRVPKFSELEGGTARPTQPSLTVPGVKAEGWPEERQCPSPSLDGAKGYGDLESPA